MSNYKKVLDLAISLGKENAIELAKSILDYYSVDLKGSDYIDELIEIAIEFEKKGDFDKAIELYTKAEKRAKIFDDKKGLSSIYGNMGVVYSTLKDYNKAIEFYEKAIKIADINEDYQEMGILYNNIGFVYKNLMKYQESAQYYFKSLEYLKKVDDKLSLSATYFNLAEVYSKVEDFESAVEFIDESIKIDRTLNKDALRTDLKFRDYLEKKLTKTTGKNKPLEIDLHEDENEKLLEEDDKNDSKKQNKFGLSWLWKKKY
jgi:tetratricopeptide (TPR) repeat protein